MEPMGNISPANNNGLMSPQESSRMFISTAWAQAATDAATGSASTGGGGGFFSNEIYFVLLVFFLFYVIVLRPQNQRIITQRRAIDALEKGDKIITGGGLVATVRKMAGDEDIEIEIAPGVIVTAVRSTIMSVRDSAAQRRAAADKDAAGKKQGKKNQDDKQAEKA
jgi:preprotein translocase subunit YajC